MARRRVRAVPKNNIIEIDHPEGGRFGIYVMSVDVATEYAELVTTKEFVRDAGAIVFSPKTGAPAMQAAVKWRDLLDFAVRKVIAYVRELDSDDGAAFEIRRATRAGERLLLDDQGEIFVITRGDELLESDTIDGQELSADQVLENLLMLMGEDQVDEEVPIDKSGNVLDPEELSPKELKARQTGTKKISKPSRDNLYLWATRKSAQAAAEQNKVERGN